MIHRTLKIEEEYFGYYDQDIHPAIISTIDDMLIESGPIHFETHENQGDFPNYLDLLDEAWRKYLSDQESFNNWQLAKN